MTVFIVRSTKQPLAPVDFALTELERNKAVFTNPAHERLSKIVYSRMGSTMNIRLEGKRNNAPFVDELVLKLEM